MGNTRREFTPEYKDEAVKLVINTGRPPATVARELGVKEQTLGRWVNLFRERQAAGDGALSETERAELARLRKENSELKMARAFLKKASLRCEATMNDYFVFIGAEKAFFPIDWMCRKLKVARASYYRWLAPAALTLPQVRHGQLEEAVLRVFDRRRARPVVTRSPSC